MQRLRNSAVTGELFQPPELGCVLYLPGIPGGSSKVYDRSPYSNHGTITGATWKRLPYGLWYLSFDGIDDYVNCGAGGSLKITDNLMLEFWIKPTNGNYQNILGRWNASGNERSYNVHFDSGNDGSLQYAASTDGTAYQTLTAIANLTDGTWYHVVITQSGTTARIYINGVLDNEKLDMNAGINAGTSDFYLGKVYSGFGDARFNGNIALLRIYNRVLSLLEMQNHFAQEKHLFGEWQV